MNSSNIKDDSHLRWADQTEMDVYIWNYYNEIIATNTLNQLLKKENISFTELYHKMALTRAECEWIKSYINDSNIKILSPELINHIAKSNLYFSFPNKFASFQGGGSNESNILMNWGNAVANLAEMRIDIKKSSDYGFSLIFPDHPYDGKTFTLYHPRGYVLMLLENDFQKLLRTNNLFEFIVISSRMMYMLSNFPPIERGSAAVNCWIIDKIAKEKFQLQTNTIRPKLYDWIAFFNTPNQYTNYYVMAVAVNYIKSFNLINGINEFEEKLFNLAQENPNTITNVNAMENLWHELQFILSLTMNTNPGEDIIKHLNEIANGHLEFIKPSNTLLDIINILQKNKFSEKSLTLLSSEQKEYVSTLLQLSTSKNHLYLSVYGLPDEAAFHFNFSESLFLNALLGKDIILAYQQMLGINTRGKNNAYWIEFVNNNNQFSTLNTIISENPIYKWGFIDINRMDSFKKLIELSVGIENEVSLALKNGMNVSELNKHIINGDINRTELEILVSRATITIYKMNPDISIKDLLMETPTQTEINILSILAKHYGDENAINLIHDDKIRQCLLLYLDPCLLANNTLSDLIRDTEDKTKINILTAYLKHYNLEHLNPGDDASFVTAFLNEIIKHNANQDYISPSKIASKLSKSLSKITSDMQSHSMAPNAIFFSPDNEKNYTELTTNIKNKKSEFKK